MELRKCIRCLEEKPVDQFYFIKARGGYDSYCKECKIKMSAENYKKGSEMARSTKVVLDKLKELGIPAGPGAWFEQKWVDIVAYGFINIEAKGSTLRYKNGKKLAEKYNEPGYYQFVFSKYEKSVERKGFVILVTYEEPKRFFVIPYSDPLVSQVNAVSVKLDSDHPKSFKKRLEAFENRFDLIFSVARDNLELAEKKFGA